jgi:hypothetical protein
MGCKTGAEFAVLRRYHSHETPGMKRLATLKAKSSLGEERQGSFEHRDFCEHFQPL